MVVQFRMAHRRLKRMGDELFVPNIEESYMNKLKQGTPLILAALAASTGNSPEAMGFAICHGKDVITGKDVESPGVNIDEKNGTVSIATGNSLTVMETAEFNNAAAYGLSKQGATVTFRGQTYNADSNSWQ